MSWSCPENFSSFALSASSWTVMNDSKAGFVIEPFVLVDLVRPDGRLDRALQFHPGDIARVIIVAQESVSAGGEEFLQGWLARRRGGFAQERGGASQLAFVFDVVGNEGELLVSLPTDHGEETFGAFLFGGGQRFDPRFDLGLGCVERVKAGAFRFRRRAQRRMAHCDRAATRGPC